MDGLSGAASIIGVISLAMQLGQVTRRLIAFIDKLKNVPKDISRLNDMLKLLFAMSASVVDALEQQRKYLGSNAVGHEPICGALSICLQKLSVIIDVVDEVSTHQNASPPLRAWAKFRHVLKEDDIIELERQLGQTLGVLNVLLTSAVL